MIVISCKHRNLNMWRKLTGAFTCCVNHYTVSQWEARGGLSMAFLAVSLTVYEACFSLTVSGIKRANPSETSDESFKRNNERHTAGGCISGWTYSKLERTARQAAKEEHNSFPHCHPQQSNYKSHILSLRHEQIRTRAHQKLGMAYKTSHFAIYTFKISEMRWEDV